MELKQKLVVIGLLSHSLLLSGLNLVFSPEAHAEAESDLGQEKAHDPHRVSVKYYTRIDFSIFVNGNGITAAGLTLLFFWSLISEIQI